MVTGGSLQAVAPTKAALLTIAALIGSVPAAARDVPRVQALVTAYPDFLSHIKGNALIWKDGTRMPIDDGKGAKPLERMLVEPDIGDMFAQPYPAGDAGTPPATDFDPGRVRYSPLFDKMYGNCRSGGVRDKLVSVAWMPRHKGGIVRFSSVNGAARQLQRVSTDLDRLSVGLTRYLIPSAGTFNCRVIAGTGRMSMHAYGVAIDINVKYTDYWRWKKPDRQGRYAWRNRIPMEIVRIFEKYGFIWGGKWYHYDTMHFEYRPELLRRVE